MDTWIWIEEEQTFIYGNDDDGCGAFFDETDYLWHGSLVYGKAMADVGPYKTLKEVQTMAEKVLEILRKELSLATAF